MSVDHRYRLMATVGSSPVQHLDTHEPVSIASIGLTERLVEALTDWAAFFNDIDGDISDPEVADEFVGQAFKLAHKLRGELKGSAVELVHPVTREEIEIIRQTPR